MEGPALQAFAGETNERPNTIQHQTNPRPPTKPRIYLIYPPAARAGALSRSLQPELALSVNLHHFRCRAGPMYR
jgi:hypothetical protein